MNLLYWKSVDWWTREELPSGKVVERHIIRKLWSDHPQVLHIEFYGSLSADLADNKMRCNLSIYCSGRNKFYCEVEPEQIETLDIPEAIEFLKSLPVDETINPNTDSH